MSIKILITNDPAYLARIIGQLHSGRFVTVIGVEPNDRKIEAAIKENVPGFVVLDFEDEFEKVMMGRKLADEHPTIMIAVINERGDVINKPKNLLLFQDVYAFQAHIMQSET